LLTSEGNNPSLLKSRNLTIFVVLGRLGQNLSISKLAPICEISSVSRVYAFRESAGIPYEKLEYITLPAFILAIRPKWLARFIRSVYEPVQLFIFCARYRPDFINGVYTLPKGLYSFIVGKLLRIKCMISLIGGKEEVESEFAFPWFWKQINLIMLKHCHVVLCKGQRDIVYLIKEGIPAEKIYVFNGGIDTSRFHPGFEEKTTDIVFAGRLELNKGPMTVCETVLKLKQTFPGITCFLLGEGPLEGHIRDFIRHNNLASNIHLTGYVRNPEDYYKKTKIFMLPSSNEGLSTAMLEAMACRCIPVVSDVGNMNEAVADGENGYLVPVCHDNQAYTDRIMKLVNNIELLEQFASAAMNTVKNKYGYCEQAAEYEKPLLFGRRQSSLI
jgi:glycosyltransferase involved in cell wall biosynthesis